MSIIRDQIANLSEVDARSVLYYAGRYVKQAGYFDEYGKDIFEDEERSAPTSEIRQKSTDLIDFIERREKAPIAEIDDARVTKILREITSLEDELGPVPSPDEVARAENFVENMRVPPSRR